MSDDYEPAIDMPGDSGGGGDEPAAVADAIDPNDAPHTSDAKERAEPADSTSKPRGQRVVNDKVRDMLKAIAKAGEESGGLSEDLVPMGMEDDSPPAAAEKVAADAPASQAEAPTSTPPAAAAVAPAQAAIEAAAAAAEHARVLAERREKQLTEKIAEQEAKLAEREKALAEREKTLPDMTSLVEKPGATLAAYLKSTYGALDPEGMRGLLEDMITEISEAELGIKLPAEVKQALESRRAVRSIKAYKADVAAEKKRLDDERAAIAKQAEETRKQAEEAAKEAKLLSLVDERIQSARNTYPFLMAQESPAEYVLTLLKKQAKSGQSIDWEAAAREGDNFYRNEAEKLVKKANALQSLLAPATPAAPAKAVAQPGAAPGPAAKPQPKPAEPTTPVLDEASYQHMDRHERRAMQVRQLKAKHFSNLQK